MSFLEDIDKERLVEFVKFVKNELGIKVTPTIKLLNGRGELKTTAHYNYSSNLIVGVTLIPNSFLTN